MRAIALIALIGALASPAGAYADTAQQLLRATSDAYEGNLDIQVLVDADSVATGLQYVSPKGESKAYDLKELPAGMVLLAVAGKNAVTLKSPDFDPAHGGHLQITYIHNALTDSYRTLDLEIVRTGDRWELLATDQSGHPVVTLGFFKAKRIFGQVVGIDQITLN